VVIGPINLPVGRLFVEEVITECRKPGASRADVLAFEFEMGLFPAALEEARGKGIDLTPETIPPEVFDKCAVDKGQVQFFDIAYVEAMPRYAKGRSAKDKLTLAVELTDFSVHCTQGAAEAAEAALKEGKSAAVCHDGQLYKLSKSKAGVLTRERLTKAWTDWVDYWAADFDYGSRKEMIKVQRGMGIEGHLPGIEPVQAELQESEERWTSGYIFENEWQSFRTRQNRQLELITSEHSYAQPGRYTVAVKVIDIFGNDTMTLVPINVGSLRDERHRVRARPLRARHQAAAAPCRLAADHAPHGCDTDRHQVQRRDLRRRGIESARAGPAADSSTPIRRASSVTRPPASPSGSPASREVQPTA
jgi:site-specific DNA-methyltransferase (adenine-specific)/adenine-specific DNA-methyltransferase